MQVPITHFIKLHHSMHVVQTGMHLKAPACGEKLLMKSYRVDLTEQITETHFSLRVVSNNIKLLAMAVSRRVMSLDFRTLHSFVQPTDLYVNSSYCYWV